MEHGRRTGRSLPDEDAQAAEAGGGKSELRRAVCRITSGMRALRPADGQCHRKDTASATPEPDHVRGIGVQGRPGAPAEFSRLVAPAPG
jgi:hypothetical protein